MRQKSEPHHHPFKICIDTLFEHFRSDHIEPKLLPWGIKGRLRYTYIKQGVYIPIRVVLEPLSNFNVGVQKLICSR